MTIAENLYVKADKIRYDNDWLLGQKCCLGLSQSEYNGREVYAGLIELTGIIINEATDFCKRVLKRK
ncbi:MAG: hypothetical protein V3U72_01995 [Candidatus Aenigmarchaeota archaeon]